MIDEPEFISLKEKITRDLESLQEKKYGPERERAYWKLKTYLENLHRDKHYEKFFQTDYYRKLYNTLNEIDPISRRKQAEEREAAVFENSESNYRPLYEDDEDEDNYRPLYEDDEDEDNYRPLYEDDEDEIQRENSRNYLKKRKFDTNEIFLLLMFFILSITGIVVLAYFASIEESSDVVIGLSVGSAFFGVIFLLTLSLTIYKYFF